MDSYIFLRWSDADYSIGLKTIDEQHKQLIALINKIYQALIDRNVHEVTANVLDELEMYAGYHFGFEEKIFRQIGYELTDEHVAKHRAFTTQIKSFKDRMAAGEDVIFNITNYLRDWLRNHVQKEDKLYANDFMKAGVD
jgi:hemerythrin-like metal-binding protein